MIFNNLKLLLLLPGWFTQKKNGYLKCLIILFKVLEFGLMLTSLYHALTQLQQDRFLGLEESS